MRRFLASRRPFTTDRGASSTEYALLAVLIAVAIFGGVALFGSSTAGMFERSCNELPGSGSC